MAVELIITHGSKTVVHILSTDNIPKIGESISVSYSTRKVESVLWDHTKNPEHPIVTVMLEY